MHNITTISGVFTGVFQGYWTPPPPEEKKPIHIAAV